MWNFFWLMMKWLLVIVLSFTVIMLLGSLGIIVAGIVGAVCLCKHWYGVYKALKEESYNKGDGGD